METSDPNLVFQNVSARDGCKMNDQHYESYTSKMKSDTDTFW